MGDKAPIILGGIKMNTESNQNKSNNFIEGNLDLPKEFSIKYFEKLDKTGKYTQAEIILGMIAILKTVCRVELWYIHLKDSSIFNNKISSFTSAHDNLNERSNHLYKNSIRLIGINKSGRLVFEITDKGMENTKKIFPEIYKYIKKKSNNHISSDNKSETPSIMSQSYTQINNILKKFYRIIVSKLNKNRMELK